MKISIIGTGRVGAMLSYIIAERNLADKLVLLDANPELSKGQCNDIIQAVICQSKTIIIYGDYSDVKDSDIIVIAAGKPRTPNIKSRLDLASVNITTINSVCSELKKIVTEKTIIITLTNPVDVMNYFVQKKLGLSRKNTIGSGSLLDSMRFRQFLSSMLHTNPDDIEAYVIGEHGNCQVPLFDSVFANKKKIIFEDAKKEKILEKLTAISKDILTEKGCTEFAPANATARMIESIVFNKGEVMPCSVVLDNEYKQKGLSIGVPVKLTRKGAEVVEWNLSDWESQRFNDCCKKMKEFVKELE